MGRSGRFALLLALLASLLLLAACDGDSDSDTGVEDDAGGEEAGEGDQGGDGDGAAEAGDGDEVHRDATLRVASVVSPGQWDPHLGRSEAVDYMFHGPVYDTLLEFTPELGLGPQLATDWEASEDGRTLSLELREGVEFHDGTPFDADAVVENLERARSLEGALTQAQLAIVESIEAVDEHTVELGLAEADPSFLLTLAMQQAGRMASPAALEDPEQLATEPAGTGLYALDEQAEERLVFQRVSGYWDAELDARAPERIEYSSIGDEEARYRALEAGDFDLVAVTGWRPELDEVLERDEFKLQSFTETTRAYQLTLHYDRPGLDDPRVRRALAMAIDREAIGELLGPEVCVPTASALGPNDYPDLSAALDAEYAHDPDGARELLEEAGVTDLTIRGIVNPQPLPNSLAVAVQAQLAEVGITMELDTVPPAELLGTWREGAHDMFIGAASGYPDPHFLFREWYYGANAPGTAPDEFVALDEAANTHPIGSAERDAAYEEVGGYLLEDPLHVVVCRWPVSYIARDRVVGLDQMSYGQLQLIMDSRYLAVHAR